MYLSGLSWVQRHVPNMQDTHHDSWLRATPAGVTSPAGTCTASVTLLWGKYDAWQYIIVTQLYWYALVLVTISKKPEWLTTFAREPQLATNSL
jgi:hypothetical protein